MTAASAPAPDSVPELSRPAPTARRIAAHGLYETRNVLRNGEQLLVSLILPLLVLIGAHRLDLTLSEEALPSIDVITPGVLALAVMASAFTGQGIATGFERQYGVLAYLSTTPLGPAAHPGQSSGRALRGGHPGGGPGRAGLAMGWAPEPSGLIWLAVAMVLGAGAFTALGLLLAGTVRAEATLALTNVLWVLMGAAGGTVFPLNHEGAGALLLLLPSAALGEGIRTAALEGEPALLPMIILAGWAALAILAARRWFNWR